MKKTIAMMFTACLFLLAIPAMAASASEPEPSNVTITVVMPDPAAPVNEPAPDVHEAPAVKVYPIDVTEIRDGGEWQIIKTYQLAGDEKPEDIPRDSFERNGWAFTLTDIIRRESANAESRGHTETVTLDTQSDELEHILTLLTPTMEYRSDDGFAGILTLDVSSIKVETAGTRTTSHTLTVTREYPHLSSNDTGFVPKTVTDRGKTYNLAGVDWSAGNYVTVDYDRIPEYYTATATYTATGYSTTVTGYAVTADYSGTLGKLTQGMTTYVAFFLGEEIRTPLEIVTPGPVPATEPAGDGRVDGHICEPACGPDCGNRTGPADAPDEEETEGAGKFNTALLAIIPCLAAMAGGAYYFIKKRKGQTCHEETDNPAAGSDDNSGSSSSGPGG